jgi:YD repeat-containing protein
VRQYLGPTQARRVEVHYTGTQWTALRAYDAAQGGTLLREWTYTWTAGRLTGVQPPAGPPWAFTYETTPPPTSWALRLTSVTTPGGGLVTYSYQDHHQSHPEAPFDPPLFHGRVLHTRTSHADGQTADGTWTITMAFDWSDDPAYPSEASPPRPASVTIARPSGHDVLLGGCGGHGWVPDPWSHLVGPVPCGRAAYPYAGGDRVRIGGFQTYSLSGNDVVHLSRAEVFGRTVVSRSTGDSWLEHRTDITAFDPFRRPAVLEEYSLATPGVTRVTTRTYQDIEVATSERNIRGLVTSETVTAHGTTIAREYSYDPTTGFRTWQRVAGIETTFTHDGLGNVATETTGGLVTSYQYSWGQVSQITTPEHVTTRVIHPDGTIASEAVHTTPARTTTYTYDGLGRMTQTQGPGGTAPVVTEYDNLTGRAVTTRRGTPPDQSVVTTTLDGFGRPTETVDSTGVRVRTAYDPEGRVVFQGLPRLTVGPDAGITRAYDWHDRVVLETQADSTTRQFTYGPSTITTVDEAARTTTVTRLAFGHPEDARVVQLVDAAAQTWTYAYTVRGDLTSVSGPGGVQRTWTYHPVTLLPASETHPESGTTLYQVYNAAGVLKARRDANDTVFEYGHDDNRRLTSITATPVSGPVQQTTIAYEPGSDHRQTTTVDGVMAVLVLRHRRPGGEPHRRGRREELRGDVRLRHARPARDDDLPERPRGGVHVRRRGPHHAGVRSGDAERVVRERVRVPPSGALSAYTAGNGLVTTLTYDADRQWLTSIAVGPLGLTYDYDAVGNVETLTDSRPAMSQAFTYDALDRLLTASSSGYPSQTFAYDAHGNRQDAGGTTYAYYGGNPFRLWQVNGVFNLTYDDNGNVTGGTFGTYQYTPDNLVRTSTVGGTTVDFAYDRDAWRVRRAPSGGPTQYFLRGPNGQLLTEWTNTSPTATVRDYVYAGRRLLAVVTRAATPK